MNKETEKTEYNPQTMKIEITAYQVIEKVVKSSGNSGRVYVPPDWIGKRVKILLIEPTENADK